VGICCAWGWGRGVGLEDVCVVSLWGGLAGCDGGDLVLVVGFSSGVLGGEIPQVPCRSEHPSSSTALSLNLNFFGLISSFSKSFTSPPFLLDCLFCVLDVSPPIFWARSVEDTLTVIRPFLSQAMRPPSSSLWVFHGGLLPSVDVSTSRSLFLVRESWMSRSGLHVTERFYLCPNRPTSPTLTQKEVAPVVPCFRGWVCRDAT